jgi:hypothetical protein
MVSTMAALTGQQKADTLVDLKAALMVALTAARWEKMSVDRKEFLSVEP